jgi:hypothetical protein
LNRTVIPEIWTRKCDKETKVIKLTKEDEFLDAAHRLPLSNAVKKPAHFGKA